MNQSTLTALSILFVAIMLAGEAFLFVSTGEFNATVFVAIIIAGLLTGNLFALRLHQRLVIAQIVFCCVLVTGVSVAISADGGIDSPLWFIQLLVIFGAGFVFGTVGSLVAGIYVLSMAVGYYLLSEPNVPGTLETFTSVLASTGLFTGLSYLYEREKKQADWRASQLVSEYKQQRNQALHGANVGIWDWKVNTGELLVSDTFNAQLGYPGSRQWTFAQFCNALHVDDRTAVSVALQACKNGLTDTFEQAFRLRRGSGDYQWVLSRATADRDAGFLLRGAQVDISELKAANRRVEEQLRKADESEARFRNIANSAPVAIWLLDENGEVTWVNDYLNTFRGIKAHERTSMRTWLLGVHKDDQEQVRLMTQEAVRAQSSYRFECRLRQHDGEFRWVQAHIAARYDRHQRFMGFVGIATDVHDSHMAQASQLADAQRQARISLYVTDHASDAVFWIRRDGSFSYVNKQAARYLGYTRDELLGLTVFDTNPAFPRSSWLEHWQEMQDKQVFAFESSHQRKDGSSYPCRIVNHFVSFEGTRFIFASVRDITAEKASLFARERAEYAIDKATVSVYLIAPNGRFLYVNDFACAELGYSREELLSMGVADIDSDVASEEHFEKELWADNQSPVRTRTHQRKDGSTFPVRIDSSRIKMQGQVPFAFCYVKNLTEEQYLQDQVRELAERMDWAMKSANVGIWDWNPATGEVFFSDEIKTQLGYPTDTKWSSFADITDLAHADDVGIIGELTAGFIEQPVDTRHATFRLRSADAGYRYIQSIGRRAPGQKGEQRHISGVHIDITELHQERDALQRSNLDLEHFAYVASHDLQEPLRAIGGFLQLLKKRNIDQLDDKARGYIDKSVDGAARMSQLINDLLYYSRLTRDDAPRVSIDLNEILDSVANEMEVAIAETGTDLHVGELSAVRAASGTMNQLFRNLVSNAIKYRSTSQPTVSVFVAEENARDDFVCIAVRDNGIGIAAEYQEQIFTLFKRLHRREDYPGTGIGLAVCKRIVEQLDGTISVESTEGQGSCFIVSLPKASRTG